MDIRGREKLIAVFGHWPSFHDAEVLRLTLDREGSDGVEGPTAECTVHTWDTTGDTDENGYYATRNHMLTTLRFLGVTESYLTGFNHQNALFDLVIEDLPEHQADEARQAVFFSASDGMAGELKCRAIEVVSVVPCDRAGRPLST